MTRLITVDTFQPFERRQGVDQVMRLRFQYDPVLIGLLKECLQRHRQEAVNPAKFMHHPGGWYAPERCWWVERSIWPFIREELEAQGYVVRLAAAVSHE